MKLLKYITIEPDECFDKAIIKIKSQIRETNFCISESPYRLGGNHKVLKLLSKDNLKDFIKIDGPGFIIDKIFEYFIFK